MNASVLQDKLYHQLRMVDAEAMERRALRLDSYMSTADGLKLSESAYMKLAEERDRLYARAKAIRASLEPKG